MFDIIIVEGVCGLILATTILRSIFAKQKHQILLTIILAASILCAYIFTISGPADLIDNFDPFLYKSLGDVFLEPGMEGFYVVFIFLVLAILNVIVLCLVSIPVEVGIKNRDMKENKMIVNDKALNIILGVIRALFYIFVYLLVLSFISPAIRMNFESSWLMGVFNNSIFVASFKEVANKHNFDFILKVVA